MSSWSFAVSASSQACAAARLAVLRVLLASWRDRACGMRRRRRAGTHVASEVHRTPPPDLANSVWLSMESPRQIWYDASPADRSAIEEMQRSEDVRFSPNNCRLALAEFNRDRLVIADIEIKSVEKDTVQVSVANVSRFSSHRLHDPHGVNFLDDDTIIVASRAGSVTVHDVARRAAVNESRALTANEVALDPGLEPLNGPSAVAVVVDGNGTSEVLVCNFYGNTVTSHVLHRHGSTGWRVISNDVLLSHHLGRPDGVAVTFDGAWIALSNLDPPRVLLYERQALRSDGSDPHGILRGVWHPHGLQFSADGQSLFVADAETPYVHVYTRLGATWRGVQHHPTTSVRVIGEPTFQRGRGPGRGGPKGIDIDRSGRVVAVTCEQQPLAFLDVSAMLERGADHLPEDSRQLSSELAMMRQERIIGERYEARIASIAGSRSFRITKPLRGFKRMLKRR